MALWTLQTDRTCPGGLMHGLKQSSPTWPRSLSPKLRLPFPSPASPTCSPKLFPFPRRSGFALQLWGLWVFVGFLKGFMDGELESAVSEAITPLSLLSCCPCCHLLCTDTPLLLSPTARATKHLPTTVPCYAES